MRDWVTSIFRASSLFRRRRQRREELVRLTAHAGALAGEVDRLREAMAEKDNALRKTLAHAHDLKEASVEKETRLREAWEHAHKLNDALQRLDALYRSADYNNDSLMVFNKDVAFLRDEAFIAAYRRGMRSGHKIGAKWGVEDLHIEWRVHVACWAARRACALPGDFVECGVNTGILSLAVCQYTDFNSTGKRFFLFDTYCGLPETHMTPAEREQGTQENSERYEECYALAVRNFAPYPRAQLVRGTVPETLETVAIEQVSYLSIDMNLAQPEVAAIEFFWSRLVPGAAVILDDYGWKARGEQKVAMDRFASEKGVPILLLPTGQGLILKP
jgi:O-methyltransferase